MVRPANFGYNEETAINNAFQVQDVQKSSAEIQEAAICEFDNLVKLLKQNGIQVIVADDLPYPQKPDAIFPNNWVSFHQNGSIITYPMFSPVRRLERNLAIFERLKKDFDLDKLHQLEAHEDHEQFLEGTGSMVLDRVHKLAYACISPRTDIVVLEKFCKFTGYEAISFRAIDEKGRPIYHTNVMMALGKDFAIICLDTIRNKADLKQITQNLKETGKNIITISIAQMKAFAGNMLQLKNKQGQSFLLMSEQAYKALTKIQIKQIETYTQILYSPIYTIEKFGGGSVRCMMAEIFMPQKENEHVLLS